MALLRHVPSLLSHVPLSANLQPVIERLSVSSPVASLHLLLPLISTKIRRQISKYSVGFTKSLYMPYDYYTRRVIFLPGTMNIGFGKHELVADLDFLICLCFLLTTKRPVQFRGNLGYLLTINVHLRDCKKTSQLCRHCEHLLNSARHAISQNQRAVLAL